MNHSSTAKALVSDREDRIRQTAVLFAAAAAIVCAALALPAHAHHSGAMFDHEKTITLNGTVKSYKWMNPHTMIEVTVPDAAGKQVDWYLEGSTPNILARKGWGKNLLKSGDKVILVVNPMKDGGPAGLVKTVTMPSGEVLKDHDY